MRDLADRDYPTESMGASAGIAKQVRDDVTLRQNIDNRIAQAEANLKELQETKARLESSNLLDTRIDDLSRAMRY